MNIYLKEFIEEKFKKSGKALDLGAGDFSDINYLSKLNCECEGVDIKTGIDLEKYYLSEKNPFNLVFSNYVIHKIKNKKQFVKIIFENLIYNGWFFIHTFDKEDKTCHCGLTEYSLKIFFIECGFKKIKTKVFDYYDNEQNHNHWHKVLQVTGQK